MVRSKTFTILVCAVFIEATTIQNDGVDELDGGTRRSLIHIEENVTSWTEIVPRLTHHEPHRHSLGESQFPPPRYRQHKENLFYDSKVKPKYCQRTAKCQNLTYPYCMGAKLPYTSTSLELTDLSSQEEVQEKLHFYQALRNVPKCWAVIQPFLCSLYMPRCEDGKVDLPSKQMCTIMLGPCKIVHNTTFLPDLANCDDSRLFPAKCKNDVRELKFNTSGACVPPLVATDSTAWFYEGIEECGLQCKDPLYTDSEHQQIHKLVAWGAAICLLFNAFTVLTFLVDWKSANKYPALVIFYINCCFLVSCVGWLAQFYGPDSRDDVVCRRDGTLRRSEPSAEENLSCVIVFVLVYYFLMAAMAWFVILTYAWHLSFQALGKIHERIDKKRAYFHLVAWSLPLVLTITTMALGEIDGDSISGICFVGHVNPAARAGLLLGPLAAVLAVGGYFLLRGLLTLIRLKIGSREIISARASSKIRSTIVRMGLFALLTLVLAVTTAACHAYQFSNEGAWRAALRAYVVCRVTGGGAACKLEARPSVAVLQLHLLALFAAGVAMSSWVWTRATADAWARFVRRKFDCEREEPVRLQKHKVIAQAFAKRKMLYHAGRLSITFHNTHTDPVGMRLDLDSAGSHDLSSTWAAALPKLVNRRGALTGAATGSISSQRRNSLDSEVSFSMRRVSVESRRNSVDSQLSVQIAELKSTRKLGRRARTRRRRRPTRRESSTSLDSAQLGAQLLHALARQRTADPPPNLKRRAASAGLDGHHVHNLLGTRAAKIVLPAPPQPQQQKSQPPPPPPTASGPPAPSDLDDDDDDDDENVSLTISESRFNLVLSGQTNELLMQSLRRGLNIEQLSTEDDDDDDDDDEDESDGATKSRASRRSRPAEQRRRNNHHRHHQQQQQQQQRRRRRSRSGEGEQDGVTPCKAAEHEQDASSLTSCCAELSQLAVQSSLNSGASVATQPHRASKQSKTSIDVGVQANAREIATQTQSAFDAELHVLDGDIDELQTARARSRCVHQGTQMSPKSVRSSRESPAPPDDDDDDDKDDAQLHKALDKLKKAKNKYHNKATAGPDTEPLRTSANNNKPRKALISYENEKLLNDKYNIKILRKKT